MSETNIYYVSELIDAKSIDDLDFELQNSFKFDYEENDNLIEIRKGKWEKYNTYEANPIKIGCLISCLMEAREKGANYVEVEDHCDHHGYEISFLKIEEATEQDIKNYKKKIRRKKSEEKNPKKKIKEKEPQEKRFLRTN